MASVVEQSSIRPGAVAGAASTVDLVEELCSQFAAAAVMLDRPLLQRAVNRYASLVNGTQPGFLPLDTPYHDVQHSIDVTRCTASLLINYHGSAAEPPADCAERFLVTLICALFHDTGYLRHIDELHVQCGAQLIKQHVSRSVGHVQQLLHDLSLSQWRDAAEAISHCTGYERSFSALRFPCAEDQEMGRLLGTADLIAQMADPAYPEKVRDRLYLEFEVAGLAGPAAHAAGTGHGSAEALLASTPEFIATAFSQRLDGLFDSNYHLLSDVSGNNRYLEQIQRNLQRIDQSIGRKASASPLLAARELAPPRLRLEAPASSQPSAADWTPLQYSRRA